MTNTDQSPTDEPVSESTRADGFHNNDAHDQGGTHAYTRVLNESEFADFFHMIMHEIEMQRQPQTVGASNKAIRQIPNVSLTAEDLTDETNRECCICMEEHRIGKNVARLPCGHVFDKNCIRKWLIDNCTCPICRYELETDSPSYEKGRLQRMAKRKPRFHTHELERMSVKELQELCERINLSSVSRKIDVVEKTDLLDLILKSEKIDVVKTAKPAAYKLSELRAMGVRELKKTMANVGVLFDPIDVLEKEDMVQIFVNSSRLIVNSESNQKCGNSKSPRRIDNSANENNKNSSAKKKRKISSCASVSQNTTTVHNPTTEKIDEDTEQRNQTVEQVEDESQPSRWSWLSNMFCFPAGFCFNSE